MIVGRLFENTTGIKNSSLGPGQLLRVDTAHRTILRVGQHQIQAQRNLIQLAASIRVAQQFPYDCGFSFLSDTRGSVLVKPSFGDPSRKQY